MLFRNCAGGIVFCGNKVLIIKNDKGEWGFPKGVIRDNDESEEVAVWRVKDETNVEARIISLAGRTSYEFYSLSRKKPVANRIKWYLMVSDTTDTEVNLSQDFQEAIFLPIEEAMNKITYTQDKSLLTLAQQKYNEINEAIGND